MTTDTEAKYAALPRVGPIGFAAVTDIEQYRTTLTIHPRIPGVYDIALWTTDQMRAFADATHAMRATGDAAEIWAAAQLVPGEGIEDGIDRIESLLVSSKRDVVAVSRDDTSITSRKTAPTATCARCASGTTWRTTTSTTLPTLMPHVGPAGQ